MPDSISLKQRRVIESFLKIGEDVKLGKIIVDRSKCNGCALCTRACAASALEIDVENKCKMVDLNPMCMSCGDCVAICDRQALEVVEYIEFRHHFRYLDRGKPEWPRKL